MGRRDGRTSVEGRLLGLLSIRHQVLRRRGVVVLVVVFVREEVSLGWKEEIAVERGFDVVEARNMRSLAVLVVEVVIVAEVEVRPE